MHQYYVYEHWRKDLNQCFYVGIGKVQRKKGTFGFNAKYSRAFECTKRSEFWKNIYKKTEREIKIVFETIFLEQAKSKEIELIRKYGRKAYDKDGILVNFDVGGGLNVCPKRRNIKIIQIEIDTEKVIKIWNQPIDIEKKLGFLRTNIIKCCKKKQITAYGYRWKYLDKSEYDNIYPSSARKKSTNRGVGVNVFDKDNNLLNTFRTVELAAKYYNLDRSTLSRYLSGKQINKYHIFKYRTWDNTPLLGGREF